MYHAHLRLSKIKTQGEMCTVPDNGVVMCSSSGSSVCGFTCINGFTSNGSNYVCESPNTVCNGVCGSTACPTGIVVNRRGYRENLRKRATCPVNMMACGVYERRSAFSDPWECVDTQNDLESRESYFVKTLWKG